MKIKEYVNLKQKDGVVVTKEASVTVDADSGVATFVITTDDVDRDMDRIDPDGIDFSMYIHNPVVLWGHDRSQFPVAKCIPESIKRVDNGWIATAQFIPVDVPIAGERSQAIYQMIKEGFLSAVSIGFIPTDLEPNDLGGYDILSCALHEFSIVTVPSNPYALVQDDEPEEVTEELDDTDQDELIEDLIADELEKNITRIKLKSKLLKLAAK